MMKRTFDDCFGEEGDLNDDFVAGEVDEADEDWKAPIMSDEIAANPVQGCTDTKYQMDIPDHRRTIVHIDLDCFYAQVEMIRNPSLRDKPLGIQQKNIVVTTNYVAREHGVGKLSYIKDALQKCPDLVLVSGEDLTHYREMSYKVTEVLQKFDQTIERLGFDENYINVSSLVEQRLRQSDQGNTESLVTGHVYNNEQIPECTCGCHRRLAIGFRIAKEMRDALYKELGMTSCAGIAHNKLLAKLVGGHKKPNNQTLLYPEQAWQLMISLGRVRGIPGIGHSTGKRLAAMGISTVQDLQEVSKTVLESEFGHQQASRMYELSHGVDKTPVVATGLPQSISDEDSFKKCSTSSDAKERMLGLLQNLLKRLKSDGRIPQTIRVTIRKYSTTQWKRESRQCSLAVGSLKTLDTDENATLSKLLDTCISLFQKMVDTSKPFHLTLINICFAKMPDNTKTGHINHFFTPKSRTSETASLNESPGTSNTSDIKNKQLFHLREPDNKSQKEESFKTAQLYDKQVVSVNKDKPRSRTLEAFFASPKRKKVKASEISSPKHSEDSLKLSSPEKTKVNPPDSKSKTYNVSQRTCLNNNSFFSPKRKQHFTEKTQSVENAKRDTENGKSNPVKLCDSDIPPNMDPDVFRQLPAELQQELRADYISAITHKSGGSASVITPGLGGDRTARPQAAKESLATSSSGVMCKNTTQLQSEALSDKTSHVSASDSDTGQPSSSKSSVDDIIVPPDVDPDVFTGLPSDMQKELIDDWKRKTKQSKVDGLSKRAPSHSKGKHKARKSISDYFGK